MRFILSFVLCVGIIAGSASAEAQDPRLIKDRDMIRDRSGQFLRNVYKDWYQQVFNYWQDHQLMGLAPDDLHLDEVVWYDQEGNPITVQDAIVAILEDQAPVLVEAYGDYVAMEGIEDWDEIAEGFEAEVQIRIERASGALLAYRNAYVALGEHYAASKERYAENMGHHEDRLSRPSRIPRFFSGLGSSETAFRHISGSMAMNDVNSLRDIRRLITIMSGIDGTQAAHELSSIKAAVERSRDSFDAQVNALDAEVVPPAPGPLYNGD